MADMNEWVDLLLERFWEDAQEKAAPTSNWRADRFSKARNTITAKMQEIEREARINELKRLRPPEQYAEYAQLMGSEQCTICGFNAMQFSRHIDERIEQLSQGGEE